MEQYIAAVIAAGFGAVVLGSLLLIARFLPPRVLKDKEKTAYDRNKESVYECGVEPTGDARSKFNVKFFLVAMLFVIFDLEVVLVLPWAVTFKSLGLFGFVQMMIFLGILEVGLVYVWKKGALDW